MPYQYKKHLVYYLITIWGCLNISAQDFKESDILGIWLMANQNVKIRVNKVDNKYEGKVIWMDTDANKKNFSMGSIIVDDLKYNNTKRTYEHGHFYGRGHKLKCEVKLIDLEKLQVRVSKGFIKQTRYCTRAKTTKIY